MTTSLPPVPRKKQAAARCSPASITRTVALTLIDRPLGVPAAPTLTRRPDIDPGSDALGVIEVLRPIIVRRTSGGRYECIGNVAVLDWLVELSRRPGSRYRDRKVRVVVVDADTPWLELLQKVEELVVPLLFGRGTYRQQRDGKRELRAAGIEGLSTRRSRRGGTPLVRED